MEFIRLDPDDDGGEPDSPAVWLTLRSRPVVDRSHRPARKRGTASSILMAAMLGLVDALGWERPKEETVEVADAPIGGDGLTLDYKHLEPLDD
ncbi:MAG: hypothetical protein OEV40_11390 [Acidimicrobiia bacterium]|nr:hypothetical protein [Acidimicrobiia bacterium]